MTTTPKNYVFDFDSTFISVEALEELALISLKKEKSTKKTLKQIKEITDKGIDGSLSFFDGLSQRLQLIKGNKADLKKLIKVLKKKISPSIKRNKEFFQSHQDQVYILSAGFKEFIVPVVKSFGIDESRVYANTFEFDKKDNIVGFDQNNPLCQSGGKEVLLNNLALEGDTVVIGDGYSDFRMKKYGDASKFFAYTENIERSSAVEEACHVAPTLEEVLFEENLPRAHSFPKNRIKVLLLENIHQKAKKAFEKEGYQVELLLQSLSEKDLIEKIKDVSILGIRSKSKITPSVLASAKRLMSIGAFCIGTNQIDLTECTKKGVGVFNAPFSNTRSVVELAIGQIILLMRGVFPKDRAAHKGVWLKSAENSNEVRGKTLGIVGYGNIGSQLSILAEAMGMKVIYFDKVDKLGLGNSEKCDSMEALFKKADIISLHVDGDPSNSDFIGKKEFSKMKKGVVFLNLSRGFVVKVPALVEAMKKGHVRGASVDVFPKEPKSNSEAFESELLGIDNLILTPHIGGSTQEAQENIGDFVPGKIIQFINSGSSFNSVNLPNIQLPELKGAHRIIHIHKNVPGIMAKINRVLASHKINILGQYLKTNEEIGYVITDIDKQYGDEVLAELKNIPETIKFRVLY